MNQLPVHKDPRAKYGLLGLVVLIIIATIIWSWNKKDEFAPTSQNPNTPTQTQPASAGAVKYNTQFKIIRTATRPEQNQTLKILNIGTITTGEYKDKVLALALYGYEGDYGAYGNASYVYYISDDLGNPIAWDQNFVHNIYFDPGTPDLIGLNTTPQRNLSFLPKEFSTATSLITDDLSLTYSTYYGNLLPKNPLSALTPVGKTQSGMHIVKDTTEHSATNPYLDRFFVEMPFGSYLEISPEPNFFGPNDVPQITWNNGTKSVAAYKYGQYGYGWQDCFRGITKQQLESSLRQTGSTVKGDPVFEVDSQTFPSVYVCLHQKTKRYVYNPELNTGNYEETITYTNFVPTHPMFFWKNSQGDLMGFLRSDVVPAAEKAKPVVYLYPEKTEKVSVRVNPIGGFTITIPEYEKGWNVTATPEGKITNTDGKIYPYLFWEGGKEGVVETPEEGFVVAKKDVGSTLESTLAQFGLNKQERADFIEFWEPKLSLAPYYFITFISRSEIDRVAPMTITPRPDTVVRVLMDYKPLEKPIKVQPLEITPVERKGFTAVEWGGIVR